MTKIKASIDIGSNTVLLLVGKVQEGKVIPLTEKQETPRLGKGVDEENHLDPKAVQRVVDALLSFKSFLTDSYPKIGNVKVMATSAVRDAKDKAEFIKRIKKETRYETEILSGQEEAKLMYRGAKSVLTELNDSATVIDIGGGSTEIAVGSDKGLGDHHSFDMGSVRFTERYLSGNPPTEKQVEACREAIRQMLSKRFFQINGQSTLIGIAGTVTSIASIDAGLQSYQPKKLNGYDMPLDAVSNHVNRMAGHSSEELLEQHPNILKGRAEVLLGGLLILETFMNYYNIQTVTISTGGIRHGALLRS